MEIVYSQHSDLVPVFAKDVAKEDGMDLDEKQKRRLMRQHSKQRLRQSRLYKPSQQSACAKGRIIRVVGMAVDPLEPPKFKHRRVPREEKAREAVAARSKVQKEMMMEEEKKGMELRVLAQKVRIKKSGVASANDGDMSVECERDRDGPKETEEEREERLTRENIHKRVRERRLEAKDGGMGKKGKISRDRDRDISEKVALGMANTGASGGEVMYDQRLFHQEKGMDSGFGSGMDDAYNIYDNGLFTAQSALTTLYNPKKDRDDEMHGGADEQLDKIKCVKVDRAFTGTSERSGPRDRPVEFDKEQDPFGLDQFLKEVKMKESGGSMRDGSDKDLP
ncbi:hypothetical protein SASPL_130640 [Salvia splendens]|uniref:SKI-interacting protein SKIP SNW domain-containing protein n=1 Tax=Salvia splendens TaxID=180675 RepID=A0A8X8X7M1_SALSN|nr:hypothetical protein SASPL_130640 [Salvia splendens]